MINLNRMQKITVTVDPFTYLAINNIAKLKGITIEEAAEKIIVNDTKVYDVAEVIFKTWAQIDEEDCTKDDE